MESPDDVALVAWFKINSGTCGRDNRNNATPCGPATAPRDDGTESLEAWVAAVVAEV
jgi:hypothetical protein